MAPQTTLTTGDSRKTSTLGKHSREPLAEVSTNAQAKRKKPAPDLYPGENEDQPSSDTTVPALDDVADEVLFDLDEEDVERETEAKAEEQARLYEEWFRDGEHHPLLARLDTEEQLARMENCRQCFSYILGFLIETARLVKWEDFARLMEADSPPMTPAWWRFFTLMSVEKVLDRQFASLVDVAKVILGGPLTREELLMLPSQWKGCKLWAIYGNFFDNSVSLSPELKDGRYCGSGTDVRGAHARLQKYESISRGTPANQRIPNIAHGCSERTSR